MTSSDSATNPGLAVFLMNRKQINLSLKKTPKELTASDVLDQLLETISAPDFGLSFDSRYKKLFSIWVTSPYLELQLQPKHKPFSILAKWDSLLKKNGPTEVATDPSLIEKDEPTLCLQRNVFCDQIVENTITAEDIGALELLYYEAKLNVLEGRYPSESFEQLAAFQAAIESETIGQSNLSIDYFRTHLKEYIPRNQIKGIDGGKRVSGLIRTLSRSSPTLICAQNIFKEYKEISENIVKLDKFKLLRSYLELCWKIPCYGSAFFSAQIERPVKSKLDSIMSHFDLEVWVAINQSGLHLVSKAKPEILLSIDINDICWAVGCPLNDDPEYIPCIFIQMPNKSNETKEILQIFSRQYKLIESLLNSFIKDKRSSLHTNHSYEAVDGSYDVTDSVEPVIHGLSGQPNATKIIKTNKLCLAKFDQTKGQFVNKGSWVRTLNQRNRV